MNRKLSFISEPVPMIIGGLLLLSLLIVWVFFLSVLLSSRVSKTTTQFPLPASLSFSPTPISSRTSLTADWKTYTSSAFKFSINYPADWTYLDVPNTTYQTVNAGVWFSPRSSGWPMPQTDSRAALEIEITRTDPSVQWQPQYFNDFMSEPYKVGEISATKITATSKESLYPDTVIIANVGNWYLTIRFAARQPDPLIEEILSTFKRT